MKTNIIGAVAGLALILSVVGLVGGHQSVPSQKLGDYTNYSQIQTSGVSYFQQGIYEGGYDPIANGSTTVNIGASDLATSSLIAITASSGATTVNFPASSTLSTWLVNSGDSTFLTIQAASTTASTLAFAGGTGTTLQKATSTATIAAGDSAIFRIYRKVTGGDFNIALIGIAH